MDFMIATETLRLQLISRLRILQQKIVYIKMEKQSFLQGSAAVEMPGLILSLQLEISLMELECSEINSQLVIIKAGTELTPYINPKYDG